MLASLMIVFLLPLSLFSSAWAGGSITAPTNGTSIAPGASFNFAYSTKADYGISSYNFSVWLYTLLPQQTFGPSGDIASGHFFGRFAEPNYPGNPSPRNLPPARLVMPNFAQAPGGFGAGAAASNRTVYLAVYEEYADGTPNVGLRISLAMTQLIYNGTSV